MSSNSHFPKFIAPQVPILSAEPPEGHGWIHEIKHDGFRTLLRIDQGDIRAFTRGGHNWTDKYERAVEARGGSGAGEPSRVRTCWPASRAPRKTGCC